MTVGDSEEMAVLEAAEVGHGDPRILVLLVWVRGRLSGLGGERELCDAVCEHLARVGCVVRVLLLLVDHRLGLRLLGLRDLLLHLLRHLLGLALALRLVVTLLVRMRHHLRVLRL